MSPPSGFETNCAKGMPPALSSSPPKSSGDAATAPDASDFRNPRMIEVDHFHFFYGQNQALFDIHMDLPEREITAFIGPS